MGVTGGEEVLLECGFRKAPRDMEQFYILDQGVDLHWATERIGQYLGNMRLAISQNKDAPAVKLRKEKEEKEAAIKLIEDDIKRKKQAAERGKMRGAAGAAGAGAAGSARDAALRRATEVRRMDGDDPNRKETRSLLETPD